MHHAGGVIGSSPDFSVPLGVKKRWSAPPCWLKRVIALFHRQVDETGVAKGKALVDRPGARRAVAFVVLACRRGGDARGWRALQNDVHDAGDGVRAVLGGGAVLQHFDVVDRADRDEGQVGCGRALVGAAAVNREIGGRVAALAVHQHQGVVRIKAAERRRQRQLGGVGAVALRIEGGQRLRQHLHDILLANDLEGVAADHLNRRRAVDRLQACRAAGAGHDDLGRGWVCGGVRRQGRRGDRRAQCEYAGSKE